MKSNKYILSLAILLILSISLLACSDTDDSSSSADISNNISSEEPSSEELSSEEPSSEEPSSEEPSSEEPTSEEPSSEDSEYEFDFPKGTVYTTSQNNSFTTNVTNEETLKLMEELTDIAAKYTNVAVYLTDVDGTYFFSINENKSYYAASTIKAVYAKYLLSIGVDLNEKLTLLESQKRTGSGTLDDMPAGTEFTVRKLIEVLVTRSDCTAYQMLLERYGAKEFCEYAKTLGVDITVSASRAYPYCTVSEMTALLHDMYKYSLSGGDNGELLIKFMKSCSFNNQISKGITEYPVAHKWGYASTGIAFHDMALVYADTPFSLVIFTKLDESVYYNKPFVEISKLAKEIHDSVFK